MELYDKIDESAAYIASKSPLCYTYGLVLGTGLGRFAERISDRIELPYGEIPHFPVSTVDGHAGKLILGKMHGIPVLVMSGRFHYYEGYTPQELTFPVRVMKALGVEHILLTNAAGGLNEAYEEGEVVMITDHINMMPGHPLRGHNDERLGVRFPDMKDAYAKDAIDEFLAIAKKENIRLMQGVYLGLQGPSMETPAEYNMAHHLGGDLIGMSTIPEVIVARHCEMKVSAFSIVSNICYPISKIKVTTLAGVIAAADKSALKLAALIEAYFVALSSSKN